MARDFFGIGCSQIEDKRYDAKRSEFLPVTVLIWREFLALDNMNDMSITNSDR